MSPRRNGDLQISITVPQRFGTLARKFKLSPGATTKNLTCFRALNLNQKRGRSLQGSFPQGRKTEEGFREKVSKKLEK
jgi:hypothetical protein